MSASTLPNATLTEAYQSLTPGSAALAAKARSLMPSGLSHDSRQFDPYPIYVSRALGPVKWDVDNNKYVDYFGGHGALILGHNHPAVMAAVHAALEKGTHFGACQELEVRLAELVGEVLAAMQQLARDGMTMIVVTHEMSFARDVADRVVFMDGGVIVEQGAPEEMFTEPRTDRVRQFLKRYNDRYRL